MFLASRILIARVHCIWQSSSRCAGGGVSILPKQRDVTNSSYLQDIQEFNPTIHLLKIDRYPVLKEALKKLAENGRLFDNCSVDSNGNYFTIQWD